MVGESRNRLGSWILAMLLLSGTFIVFSATTVSAGQYHYGDYDYTTDGSPTVATIKSYTGPGGAVTIPSTLGGFPVVAIGYYAFSSKGVTSVVIGANIDSIGDHAFYGSGTLTSITIVGNGHTSVDSQAFSQCRSLASASIGSGVNSIGSQAFSWCESLTSLTLPGSVTSVGGGCFYRCSALSSLTFLGLNTPSIGSGWLDGTPASLRGHAYAGSHFPAPGTSDFYGLTMGTIIPLPSAPVHTYAVPGYGQVRVTWDPPENNVFSPITSYNIYRASDNEGPYSLIASVSGLNYTDTGLPAGRTYYYAVSAVIATGESVHSGVDSATVTQSPILTIDPLTITLLICVIVIILALLIGIILVKRSKRKK